MTDLALPIAATTAGKPALPHIVAAEIVVRTKNPPAPMLGDTLRHVLMAEATFYDLAGKPSEMRILVDKVSFKLIGQAVGMIPIPGMFAGSNWNLLRGQVALIDRASGKRITRFKVECSDERRCWVADGMGTDATISLSFLPLGDLIVGEVEVGETATKKRSAAKTTHIPSFVMLSYRKLYGGKLYKRYATSGRSS